MPRVTLGGAPGALQVVPQVPEAERWCRFPQPGVPLGSPPRWRVCPERGCLSGGSRRKGEACPFPSSRRPRRMRPCRGRDAGSALALTAHTLLCGGPLPCTADPSRPAEAGRLVERLRGPEGETVRGRDGAPSVRTPSLAIREGALGYRTPQPPPLPSAAVATVATAGARGQSRTPPPSAGGEGVGCAGPAVGPRAARCLPRPAPPPSESGEGPAGPRRASGRWGAVCVRPAPVG